MGNQVKRRPDELCTTPFYLELSALVEQEIHAIKSRDDAADVLVTVCMVVAGLIDSYARSRGVSRAAEFQNFGDVVRQCIDTMVVADGKVH